MAIAKSVSRLEQLERDKRRAPRRNTRDLAIITIGQSTDVRAGESYPVQMCDLSVRGTRFVGRVPLSRGDHFVLYLPLQEQRITLLATVVHAVTDADGLTSIGAEFSCLVRTESRPETPACLEEAELSRIRSMMLGN